LVLLLIEATAFLQGQVRRTVGTLVKVGIGRLSIEDFRRIKDAATAGLAGPSLPAQGLCLMAVDYQDLPTVAMEGWPPGSLAFPKSDEKESDT